MANPAPTLQECVDLCSEAIVLIRSEPVDFPTVDSLLCRIYEFLLAKQKMSERMASLRARRAAQKQTVVKPAELAPQPPAADLPLGCPSPADSMAEPPPKMFKAVRLA